MRIHEVIYFTHELDMLEAHLEEHANFVDKFYIKESPVLWTGVEKPLIFSDNLDRFSRFNVEPMLIPKEEFNCEIPATFPEEEHKKWFDVRRSNRQRSRTYRWDDITSGSDYTLSTDADEIIDSRRAKGLLDLLPSREYEHIAIKLTQSQFWVNALGKKLAIYRVFRSDVPNRSQVKGFPRTTTPLIGWHFTNCYDPEGIRTKTMGITTHYGICGVEQVPNVENIAKSLEENKNPFRRRWAGGKLVKDVEEIDKGKKEGLDWAPKFMRENPELFPWK